MFNNAGLEGSSSGGGGDGGGKLRVLLNTTSLLLQQTKQEVQGSNRKKEDLNKLKTKDNMSMGETSLYKYVKGIKKLIKC